MAEERRSDAINLLKSILNNKNDELIPYRTETLNKLFEVYLRFGDHNAIFNDIQNYRNVFKTDPDFASLAKVWEGRILIKKNKFSEARKIFQSFIDHAKHSLNAKFYLGVIYQEQDKPLKALDFLRQVAEKSNHSLSTEARFRLGEIFFKQKKYQKAILEYSKIIYLYSDFDKLYEKSIYKTILGFKYLGNQKQYDRFFKKLGKEFPNSQYLKKLGKHVSR